MSVSLRPCSSSHRPLAFPLALVSTALTLAALSGTAKLAAEDGFPPLEPPAVLMVCDSSADLVVWLVDEDRSGTVAPGTEIGVFYDDSSPGPDLSNPSQICLGPEGRVLLLDGGTLDAVLALADRNADGDANDPGEVSIFYDSSTGGPALYTPNTLIAAPDGSWYLSDDGSRGHRILRLSDYDEDGTALGPDESQVVYDAATASVPLLTDVESLAVGQGGVLLAGDATLGSVFVLEDLNGDGFFLGVAEVRAFFSARPDLTAGDVESIIFAGDAVYACDRQAGRVLRLVDENQDGDAEDEGEASVFLDATATPVPAVITDALWLEGGLLILDNATDGILLARDLNGDADALDDGEVTPWLVDGGSTLALPSGFSLAHLAGFPPPPPPLNRYIRGDATLDGDVDISDPITTLGYLFLGSPSGGCRDAMDADDSGDLAITDGVYVLSYLFVGGPPPPAPFPEPGLDPTDDALDC